MQPKTYATMFVAAAATLFVGVAAANLIIDPQGVFGTGVLHPSPNVNTRFIHFSAYRKASAQYEGLMLGSSRANVGIPLEDLARRMGMKFANFAVTGGTLEDHVLVLDFVVRQKRRDGERLRAVFLVLDVDRFGDSPPPVRELLQPPALTGGDATRFWWRNLTVIQWVSWRLDIVRAWRRARGPGTATGRGVSVDNVLAGLSSASHVGAASAQALVPQASLKQGADPITRSYHFADQLNLLSRIVALCRDLDVELIVAVPPISRTDMAKIDRTELDEAIDRVSRVVPVWDFSGEDWLWGYPELWHDLAHFFPDVGRKMLARMFGEPMDEPWGNFGRLRRAATQ
jgi:hypothetical protein